ncbi:hypothetical protein B0A52_06189 [Exophiala mesophila]|uniref:Xylanolytic transcriptional activator regulatory domain-containing protein n=1 Tax=Exophiala mesophila TaxID=212818 RepID=A0A438N2W0_EXOME|nr:hypothetical protein B0A52_06189 [Exophiala mesophila]
MASTSFKRQKHQREQLLSARLKRYESLLHANGIDLAQIADPSNPDPTEAITKPETIESVDPRGQLHTPVSPSTAPTESTEPQTTVFQPQLLFGQNGAKLVDNNLWSRVAEEIQDDVDDGQDDSSDAASDAETSYSNYAYVLGADPFQPAFSHPPDQHSLYLWHAFLRNVNPLTKLVHVPTLQPAFEKARANINHIPSGFEALMYAIYSISILSLSDQECDDVLGQSRKTIHRYYVSATKAALARAKFMSSTSIVVLQALILHILSIRDSYHFRALWTLTGLAIRIAQVAGLHVDGTLLGLSPFESEIRRRIWWQLTLNDFRAAELCGQAKFRNLELDETSPRKPANVDDSDLFPSMTELPQESAKPTEMLWCVIRADMIRFAAGPIFKSQRQPNPAFTSEEYAALDDLKSKDEFSRQLEDRLETKYLRFCDPSQPLHLLASIVGRVATNIIRFVSHHPRRWAKQKEVPQSERQLLWDVVTRLLEQYNMAQSTPQLRRFAWNAPYFIQWQAVIHLMDTLRAEPLRADAEKAWKLIDVLYENNFEMLLSNKETIYVAVGNLCLKAYNARLAALQEQGHAQSDVPAYIVKLRNQREEAKLRRQFSVAKRQASVNPSDQMAGSKMSPSTISNVGDVHTGHRSKPDGRDGRSGVWPQEGNSRTGDDAFWLSSHTGGNVVSHDGAHDIETILAQELATDNLNNDIINWEQWDVWLGSGSSMAMGLVEQPHGFADRTATSELTS